MIIAQNFSTPKIPTSKWSILNCIALKGSTLFLTRHGSMVWYRNLVWWCYFKQTICVFCLFFCGFYYFIGFLSVVRFVLRFAFFISLFFFLSKINRFCYQYISTNVSLQFFSFSNNFGFCWIEHWTRFLYQIETINLFISISMCMILVNGF